LGPLIVALTPKDKPKPTEERIKLIDTVLLASNDTKALAAVIRGNSNDKGLALSEEQVKGIKPPMLALIGEDDPLKEGVDELKKRLPDMKVVVIDKAGHMTAFSREEFVNGLKEFLDAHRAPKKKRRGGPGGVLLLGAQLWLRTLPRLFLVAAPLLNSPFLAPSAERARGPLDVEAEDLRPGLAAVYRSLTDEAATLHRLDPKPAF